MLRGGLLVRNEKRSRDRVHRTLEIEPLRILTFFWGPLFAHQRKRFVSYTLEIIFESRHYSRMRSSS